MDVDLLLRYLREVAGNKRLCTPKTVSVTAGSDDGSVGALNDKLASIREVARPRGGLPNFRVGTDHQVVTWAKVFGDPWALHQVVESVRAPSRCFPAVWFNVTLEDYDVRAFVQDGALEDPDLWFLDAWVKDFPRPELDGLFSRLGLVCRGHEKALASLAESVRDIGRDRAEEVEVALLDPSEPRQLTIAAKLRTPRALVFAALISKCTWLWFAPEANDVGKFGPAVTILLSGSVVDWALEAGDLSPLYALQTVLVAGLMA